MTVTYDENVARPCTSCNGKGGRVIDTSSDGIQRQTWESCGGCGGTGWAGGGR